MNKLNIKKILIIGTTLICIYLIGGWAHNKNRWPFGRGYEEWVQAHTDFNGKYAVKKAKERDRLQTEILKQKEEERQKEEDRISHVQTSALHRMRQQLFEKVPESQIMVLDETESEIKFLLLTLRDPTLHIVKLDSKNLKVQIKAIGPLGNDSVRGTDLVRDAHTGKIYASYVTTDHRRCSSLVVDEIHINDKFDAFESKNIFNPPCLLAPNTILETGGRMAFDSQHNLYLTVGDFGKGFTVDHNESPFGKTLIRRGTNPFTAFSLGHRNSQGMYFDEDSQQIFQTEHGPQGGDEINIIRKGVHYGWPHDTYGTDYSLDTESQQFHANKGDVIYGHHDRYEKPIYAFTPSIGIAAIKRMPKTQWEFPNWRRDWFIVGMATGNMYRLEIEKNRVILAEPISTGRIRSFEVLPSGRILASRPDGLILITREHEEPSK